MVMRVPRKKKTRQHLRWTVVSMQRCLVRQVRNPIIHLLIEVSDKHKKPSDGVRHFSTWLVENSDSGDYDSEENRKRGELAAEALYSAATPWERATPKDLENLEQLKLCRMQSERAADSRSVAGDSTDTDKMDKAADYADEWFVHEDKAVRVFYVCNRLCGQDRCCTMIASSQWNRKHLDPCAIKQRWYCRVCQARYTTTSGVMIQMAVGGQSRFIRAEFLPQELQKIKRHQVRETHKGALTPEALLEAIPEASPLSAEDTIAEVPGMKGVYSNEAAVYDSIPKFDWKLLFSRCFLDSPARSSTEPP